MVSAVGALRRRLVLTRAYSHVFSRRTLELPLQAIREKPMAVAEIHFHSHLPTCIALRDLAEARESFSKKCSQTL